MKDKVHPNHQMIHAIADVMEGLPRITEDIIEEMVAALGQAAARMLAATAESDEVLRGTLEWFSEQVERDALEAYHRKRRMRGGEEPEDFR